MRLASSSPPRVPAFDRGARFAAALLLLSGAAGAADDPIDLAQRYLTALYAVDKATLTELTSPDLLFHDSTSGAFPNGPWRFQGREAVLGFFEGSVATVESSSFDILRSFTSSGRVVFDLVYHSTGDAGPFGSAGTKITLAVPAVTVITVEGGRVVEHEDFVDYDVLMGQVSRQVRAARENAPAAGAGDGTIAEADVSESAFPQPDPKRVRQLEGLARSFLEAIWAFDYETMTAMLHPKALYEDYTADYFGIEPYSFQGPDEIRGFYESVNASSGTQQVAPTIRELFVAGNNVVVLIDVQVVMAGEAWGAPGRKLTGSGLTVAWLRFDGNQVIRHIDHADYDTAIRQFEAQALAPQPGEGR